MYDSKYVLLFAILQNKVSMNLDKKTTLYFLLHHTWCSRGCLNASNLSYRDYEPLFLIPIFGRSGKEAPFWWWNIFADFTLIAPSSDEQLDLLTEHDEK